MTENLHFQSFILQFFLYIYKKGKIMKKLVLLIASSILSTVFYQTIAIQSFAISFSEAVEITHAGDNRLFVCSKVD